MNKVIGFVELNSVIVQRQCEEMLAMIEAKIKSTYELDVDNSLAYINRPRWWNWQKVVYTREHAASRLIDNFDYRWKYYNGRQRTKLAAMIVACQIADTVQVAIDELDTLGITSR